MRGFPLLPILIVALILTLAWRQYQRHHNQEARNDAAPIQTVLAEVEAKRAFSQTRRRSRGYEDDFENKLYEATFRPIDGGAGITLRISESNYNRLDENMRGVLQVKGTRFIGFAPRQE